MYEEQRCTISQCLASPASITTVTDMIHVFSCLFITCISQFVFRVCHLADNAYQTLWHSLVWDDVMLADCLWVCVFKREGVRQLIRTETRIYWLTAALVCITSASNALITAFYCCRWSVCSGGDSRDELDIVFAWFKVCCDISWCRLWARVI